VCGRLLYKKIGGQNGILMKVRGLDVKWLANSEIYSETRTGSEILKKLGAYLQGSGSFQGFSKLFLNRKCHGLSPWPLDHGGNSVHHDLQSRKRRKLVRAQSVEHNGSLELAGRGLGGGGQRRGSHQLRREEVEGLVQPNGDEWRRQCLGLAASVPQGTGGRRGCTGRKRAVSRSLMWVEMGDVVAEMAERRKGSMQQLGVHRPDARSGAEHKFEWHKL
jgi:hypothetical protein